MGQNNEALLEEQNNIEDYISPEEEKEMQKEWKQRRQVEEMDAHFNKNPLE